MVSDKITGFERSMIDACRQYYGSHEAKYGVGEMCSLDDFLLNYNENKETLFQMFGGKLILEKEICYERPFAELVNQFSHMPIDSAFEKFKREYRQALDSYFCARRNNYPLYSDEDRRFLDIWSYLKYNLLNNEHLIYNRIDYIPEKIDKLQIEDKNGKPVVIEKGMKTMKAFAKLVDALGMSQELFEKFRLEHSQALNQKKLKGTLCVSIHPLDYITMSDNACGWGSCMSWVEGGCYRRGTVEMLNSPLVVVGYLKADKDMMLIPHTNRYDNMIWNNKKWRELFVVDPHVITGIKGYPYANEQLECEVIKWLRELAKKNLGREYSDTVYQYKYGSLEIYAVDSNPEVGLNEPAQLSLTARTIHMYNDFGCTKDAKHYGVFNLIGLTGDACEAYHYQFTYSAEATCLHCGVIGISGNERLLLCEDCGPERLECTHCGCSITEDEANWIGDQPLCSCCWDEEAFYCPISDEDNWRDDCYAGERRLTLSLLDDAVSADYYCNNYKYPFTEEQNALLQKMIKEREIYESFYNERWISDNCWTRCPQSWNQYFTIPAPRETEDGDLYVSVGDCTDLGLREIFELYRNWLDFFKDAYKALKEL